MLAFNKECNDQERKQKVIESASSVEAVGATDQGEEHNPLRRSLKQCRSHKSAQCKLLLVMSHSHSPPVCAESTAAFCELYACSSCVKIWNLSLLWRGADFGRAHWMRFSCGHLTLSEQQAYHHVPAH